MDPNGWVSNGSDRWFYLGPTDVPPAQIMVKLNDSFSGEGNTVLRVDETLREALKELGGPPTTTSHD